MRGNFVENVTNRDVPGAARTLFHSLLNKMGEQDFHITSDFAGLSQRGELNIDVVDQDACQKLAYWFEVAGRRSWKARYVKEVDADENTVRFWQEIYDDQGKLVEIHEKYPVDKGH